MSTVLAYQPGIGVGGDLRPAAVEKTIWPLYSGFAKAKSGLWLQAQPKIVPAVGDIPARIYPYAQYANATDDKADFWMEDRVGKRRFRAVNFQPRLVGDPATGRYTLLFPASGIGPMVCEPIQGPGNVETNDKPLFVSGTGYSGAVKFRCPVPSSTQHGVTWGATVGGILIGGSHETVFASNFAMRIDTSSGVLQVQNRYGSVMWQNSGGYDYRDGLLHTWIAVYNAQAQTIACWIDGVLVASITGGSIAAVADFVAPTGRSDRVTVGAMGGANASGQYLGWLSAIKYISEPSLADAANRAAELAHLATI